MSEQLLNIQFVQEVEKHPCLYDNNLIEYTRRDLTEIAWNEVGKKVNLTGVQCKDKWRNLRSVFMRHLKPLPDGWKKRPYYLTNYMRFTIPFIKGLRSLRENLPEAHQEEIIEQEDYVEIDSQNSTEHLSTSLSNIQPLSPVTRPTTQNVDHTKRSFSKTAYKETVMEYLNAKKARMEKNTDDAMDSRKMFLLSLLHDVNSMSDSQMRAFKRKVLDVIDEILDEPTHQPNQNVNKKVYYVA